MFYKALFISFQKQLFLLDFIDKQKSFDNLKKYFVIKIQTLVAVFFSKELFWLLIDFSVISWYLLLLSLYISLSQLEKE